jgi:hypothetical protein
VLRQIERLVLEIVELGADQAQHVRSSKVMFWVGEAIPDRGSDEVGCARQAVDEVVSGLGLGSLSIEGPPFELGDVCERVTQSPEVVPVKLQMPPLLLRHNIPYQVHELAQSLSQFKSRKHPLRESGTS